MNAWLTVSAVLPWDPVKVVKTISVSTTGHSQLCASPTSNHLRFELQQGQFTCWAQSYSTLFPPFFQSAFADKIKQLRASVLMESSYLPPYWKAFGTRCSFNTRWTSSCCAISEDLKTSKALCWLHVAGDCVAKYVGSSVNVLEARLRLVPLLYKDASIILGLLGWWTGAFSATNHSCRDGFLWIFSSVITPLWIAHVPLSSTYKCFGSSSAAEGLQSFKDWRAAHTWWWSITVDKPFNAPRLWALSQKPI